jgi:hypothetical protein
MGNTSTSVGTIPRPIHNQFCPRDVPKQGLRDEQMDRTMLIDNETSEVPL